MSLNAVLRRTVDNPDMTLRLQSNFLETWTWTWTLNKFMFGFGKRFVWSKPVFYTDRSNLLKKTWKKTKRFGIDQKWGFERRGEGSSGIQSQEGQELTAVASSLITQKSSETHIVNVTNKDMVNRYLTDFTIFSTSWFTTGLYFWRTCPSRHRTANKFLGSSGGHIESVLCSSVRKLPWLIFLQTLQLTLTIDTETLSLSITTEKTHGSPVEHGLAS